MTRFVDVTITFQIDCDSEDNAQWQATEFVRKSLKDAGTPLNIKGYSFATKVLEKQDTFLKRTFNRLRSAGFSTQTIQEAPVNQLSSVATTKLERQKTILIKESESLPTPPPAPPKKTTDVNDGKPHTFLIKIYDSDNGKGTVVYNGAFICLLSELAEKTQDLLKGYLCHYQTADHYKYQAIATSGVDAHQKLHYHTKSARNYKVELHELGVKKASMYESSERFSVVRERAEIWVDQCGNDNCYATMTDIEWGLVVYTYDPKEVLKKPTDVLTKPPKEEPKVVEPTATELIEKGPKITPKGVRDYSVTIYAIQTTMVRKGGVTITRHKHNPVCSVHIKCNSFDVAKNTDDQLNSYILKHGDQHYAVTTSVPDREVRYDTRFVEEYDKDAYLIQVFKHDNSKSDRLITDDMMDIGEHWHEVVGCAEKILEETKRTLAGHEKPEFAKCNPDKLYYVISKNGRHCVDSTNLFYEEFVKRSPIEFGCTLHYRPMS